MLVCEIVAAWAVMSIHEFMIFQASTMQMMEATVGVLTSAWHCLRTTSWVNASVQPTVNWNPTATMMCGGRRQCEIHTWAVHHVN